jgi:BarA-like signal transduction histidine kinase
MKEVGPKSHSLPYKHKKLGLIEPSFLLSQCVFVLAQTSCQIGFEITLSNESPFVEATAFAN